MTSTTLDHALHTKDATAARASAHAAIGRVSGLAPDRISVTIDADSADGFRAHVTDGVFTIEASSARTAVAGYAAYVRSTGEAHVSRFGTRPVEGALADGDVVEGRAALEHRVAYNITVSGYTTPFYSWDQWEAELDLLAAGGITSAHLTLGQELVWLRTFTRFGYSEEEILRWICPPSHQPWQWLNNIQNFGEGTTRELIERRADLARRVLARMRELDIAPIFPGFSGTVPPGFSDRNPNAPTVTQGKWFMDLVGPERPDWLSTTTEAYAEVARVFHAEQIEAFGSPGGWAVDLLHEGGKTGPFDIGEAARGVQAALIEADRDYTWVIQAWAGNPRKELLDAIDLSHVLILDLTGEAVDQLGGYSGADWAYGILPNYGGRTVLYGDLAAIAGMPERWVREGADESLRGLTNMAEGVGNNPVVWDLYGDLAWAHAPVALPEWLSQWVASRYGAANEHAVDAWTELLSSTYGPWRHEASGRAPVETGLVMGGQLVDAAEALRAHGEGAVDPTAADEFASFGFYASTDSVIAAVPSLYANQASTVGPRALGYPASALIPVLRSLLAAAPDIDAPGFDYDLVDVSRQLADDIARPALHAVRDAAEAGDVDAYDRAVETFLSLIDALERTLATNEAFLLGGWEHDARSWGSTESEGDTLVVEARRLLTCWGYEDSALLVEYATRSWAGLVGDYFHGRWATWFAETRKALLGEPTTPIDWYRIADEWVRTAPDHAHSPIGDPREAAADLLAIAERIAAIDTE